MRLDRLDHLVLTVRGIDATCAFYAGEGESHTTRARGWRSPCRPHSRGDEPINLHAAGREFEPKAPRLTPDSGDRCCLTATPLSEVLAHLAARDVPVVAGPARKEGATGPLESAYVRDPDGNLIEIANALPPDA